MHHHGSGDQRYPIDAVVSFHTLSNHVYRLESTMDLLEWTTVADVAGTGSIVTVTDQGPVAIPSGFTGLGCWNRIHLSR